MSQTYCEPAAFSVRRAGSMPAAISFDPIRSINVPIGC
jgi:hypothetical protein